MARNFHWSLPPPWFLLLIPVKASLPWRWKEEDVTDVVKALNNDREPPSSLWLTLEPSTSVTQGYRCWASIRFPLLHIFFLPVAEILASASGEEFIHTSVRRRNLCSARNPLGGAKSDTNVRNYQLMQHGVFYSFVWRQLGPCQAPLPSCVRNWRVNWTKSLRHKNYNIHSAITLFCIYWCKQTE